MYDDIDDTEDRLADRREPDPIAIAGLTIVAGTTAYLALNAWIYWDQYSAEAAITDRLRTVAFVVNPYAAALVLVGITVARLRPFLGTERTELDPRPARAARRIGFLAAFIVAIGGLVAALDSLLADQGNDEGYQLATRSELAGSYAIAAVIAATGVWMARCSPGRPAPSRTPGPPDDFDPGDFDPATFRPYAGD